MNSPLTIRLATEADTSAMAVLNAQLGYPAEEETLRGRVRKISESDEHLLLVAEDASRGVCGWLQAHCRDSLESGFRAEIIGLVVSPGLRRRGIGRRLVACAEGWAAALFADTIIVRSNMARVESHAFYPELGYRASKVQQVYQKQLSP